MRDAADLLRVLVIYAHPRRGSLSDALGDAFAEGAEGAAEVRRLVLADLGFAPNVEEASPRRQALEPDLQRAQALVAWADHLVFVYPTWWGAMPALLKAFLDRVLVAGFAFEEMEGGTGYEGLLRGKSAHLVTTMDTPRWVYRWLYGSPGTRALKRATLHFCGVRPVRVSGFGPVRGSALAERQRWLEAARRAGRRLGRGRLTPWERLRRQAGAWLKAARLQFYPMTWIAYTVGALGAAGDAAFSTAAYWAGYACLFLLEAATVLTNEYFDYESDRTNRYYSVFSGGSRVLVEGALRPRELLGGAAAALGGVVGAAALLVGAAGAPAPASLAALSALALPALGYTAPPLKLSHRGLGELDVGLTHSLGVIVCGYVFQGGAWRDAFPWLASIPLFLAVLPSILLAGLPDADADRAAGKRTLVVKLGARRALSLAMACTALSAAAGALWHALGLAGGAYGALIYLAAPHAAWLVWRLYGYRRRRRGPERIDGLIAAALAYILWFGMAPLLGLL